MLDNETKTRIDTARDILVGKVPDPKSQVEQITIALIYKFMDDMDKESVSLGGNASFFSGEYKKYSWSNIFDPKLGGYDMLNLYSEAIVKLNHNPNIPQLFRDIFKNAFLPYRDPETLKLFLKTINEFTYDHSERLGDAFEYLLSVLGSQGDAGQFRTPRHIIDFIVSVLEPKKTDTILDPACGTAGFLISAYKFILKENTVKSSKCSSHNSSLITHNSNHNSSFIINNSSHNSSFLTHNSALSPSDRRMLMTNFFGYDISPDMVRLSLVNMYLHGFTTPFIFEYDTLTSEDRWGDTFDVILANPPFMSPKGGIKPHKKFSLQVNRSEVLFVDYIAEHINPVSGRAGIIVPEGIIFQSSNAYKQLRKMLVENNLLYAVVSLPAGVFNPYSGVKTSILILDKSLAKKTDKILFVKIENDGFDLGAQRREIEGSNLPNAKDLIIQFKESLLTKSEFISNSKNVFLIEKSKISSKDDYNLSIDRYKIDGKEKQSNYDIVKLKEICELVRGVTYSKNDEVSVNGHCVLRANNINVKTGQLDLSDVKQISKAINFSDKQLLKKNDIFICTASGSADHVGKTAFIKNDLNYYFGGFMGAIRCNELITPKLLFYYLRDERFNLHLNNSISGANIKNLKSDILNEYEIPLPPLSVQKEIVSKIENYQSIINGARQIIQNYKPQIDINPNWKMVELGEICEINPETINPAEKYNNDNIIYIDISSIENGTGTYSLNNVIKGINAPSRARRKIINNDVLLSTVRPNLKAFALLKDIPANAVASTGFAVLRCGKNLNCKFVYELLFTDYLQKQMISLMGKGAYPSINQKDVESLKVPLPHIEEQQVIVTRIEKEQNIINANKELITIYEQKIKDEINKLWKKD